MANPNARERLPNRRPSESFDFEHSGISYRAEFSRYPDGRIAEVFVNGAKVNTSSDIAMRDCAIILSFALQHGCPIDAVLPALTRGHDERPLGPMGKLLELLRDMERAAA